MTTGIYKLSFTGTDKVYIGQSFNCEARLTQHLNKLSKGLGKGKLQEAYNIYGTPSMEILLECTNSELNESEIEAIEIYDSYNKGLNSTIGGSCPQVLNGAFNANAKYSEEDYWNVLYFLGIPGYSWKYISEETGVSEYVVSHISSLESHGWLKEKFPVEYKKVEEIHNSIGRMSAFMQGINYPKILSPEGLLYEVHHVTNFAKEHNLLQPKLHEVLTGTRKTHRGWHLETYTPKEDYPPILAPDGNIYVIPYSGAADFARNHTLTHTHLHSVLTGKQKSHKGWRLLQNEKS